MVIEMPRKSSLQEIHEAKIKQLEDELTELRRAIIVKQRDAFAAGKIGKDTDYTGSWDDAMQSSYECGYQKGYQNALGIKNQRLGHLAHEDGEVVCQNCNKRYHKPEYKQCWSCHEASGGVD